MSLSNIYKLFATAQAISLETLEWIGEARRCCALVGDVHGRHWQNSGTGLAVACSQNSSINEDRMIEGSDTSSAMKALIIHPRYSTWAQNHPKYNPCHPACFGSTSRDNATEHANLEALGVSDLLVKLDMQE
ncbi:hypothetical protein PILCRDRAFT_2142 [Piloderma croceum F 1598]|uniref:Uncharacterized protein n=1 Tax=Piloderma croceum (strain F 1598) TaxID=765440 RepID=A0A0C3GDU1_PILCF|nr:hypothetical protein PILCRDRAFT_2142 [Piloderma croceum F 1598]